MTEYYSLRKRLAHNLLLHMLVVMLILLVVSNLVIRSLVNDYVGSRLEHDAETLVSALRKEAAGNWSLNPDRVSSVYHRVRSGHYFIIDTPSGRLRSRSLFDIEPQLPDVDSPSRFEMEGGGGEYWLVIHRSLIKNGEPLHLWIAEDIHELNYRLHRWQLYLALLLAGLTLLLLGLQKRWIGRSFAVFDRIKRELEQHESPRSASDRSVPDEIRPLMNEISLRAEQLRKRTLRTRNAIGDLAHELKRPLQVLSLSQQARNETGTEQQAVERIRQVIERELKRARISGHEAVGSLFDPGQDLPLLVDLLARIRPEVRVDLAINAPEQLALDRDDMLELVGNLLDNAVKFAVSRVSLLLTVDAQQLRLEIEDDGPGLPGEKVERVLRQGVRLDEMREGHGLGLRICADIVDSYDGRMSFHPALSGGLKVVVVLPLSREGRVSGEQPSGNSDEVRPDKR